MRTILGLESLRRRKPIHWIGPYRKNWQVWQVQEVRCRKELLKKCQAPGELRGVAACLANGWHCLGQEVST